MILLRKTSGMDSKNIPKILQQRNCYPENFNAFEGSEIYLIHFIPSIVLSHIPKSGLHQLRPYFIGAGKSERNFRAALLLTSRGTSTRLTSGLTGMQWGSINPSARCNPTHEYRLGKDVISEKNLGVLFGRWTRPSSLCSKPRKPCHILGWQMVLS